MTQGHESSYSARIENVVVEHSTLLAALECGASVETAIERAYGWKLQLVHPQMALSQIDQIVIRGLNDFTAQNDHPVILDCGANIGISVLNYLRRFPGARITAFEPDPIISQVLRGNLARNGAGDVELIDAAVWTSDGEIPFVSSGTDGGRVDRGSGKADLHRVATVDLRRYLDTPIDLLKMDVEGAEYELISHIAHSLTNVASMVVECHLDQTTIPVFGELLPELRSAGFQLSLNTFGQWGDLVRRSSIAPYHYEQYVALYAWRAGTELPGSPASYLPYVDLSLLLEFSRGHNRRAAPAYYETEHGVSQTTLGRATKIKLSGPFGREGGFGWHMKLPDSVPMGDSSEQLDSSPIVLLEDDRPIGPPHTPHALIRKYGGGRFSHWHNALYFSTPDDSDPNLNKRRYAVAFPTAAAPSATGGR